MMSLEDTFCISNRLMTVKYLMRIVSKVVVATITAFSCHFPVSAQTQLDKHLVEEIPGLIREPTILAVPKENGDVAQLDAFITRPSKPGQYPVVIITNGTDGNAKSDRISLNPNRFSAAAIAFARRGYAAVVVLRQGYGRSTGIPEYFGGSCLSPRHFAAGMAAASDITGALVAIRKQAWASSEHALLVGMSSGGFTVLAASAENSPGVSGVIAFDPGRGARQDGQVCDKQGLMDALSEFGRQARIPTLWIYAANDTWFPPALGKEMWSSYKNAGGQAELFIAPAFKKNGHTILVSAEEGLWWGRVEQFLREHSLPADEIVKQPVVKLPPPSGLTAAGYKAFEEYVKLQSYEKAFASNGEGIWGSARWARTKQEAAEIATNACNTGKKPDAPQCRLYALGDEVVENDKN
ncbi:dienelactone hydrolase family protein [Herbaspirillum sp. DW155]|uniref:alpha/beta hydrolase family protein n=1 Tax=Herbaspirillum sp. DW155 TaxID=3095609 RepID=UPI0030933406|nr:dienelactone hydrolase family protein [Herbaspirillum sp. DW155]